jgi:diguanylate cyclase (GGDEF)-like protein
MTRSSLRRRLAAWTHSARLLTAISVACTLGLCGVAAVMLAEMRQDANRRAEITGRSLVQMLSRDVARNLELYGLSLQAVVDGMEAPSIRNADPIVRHGILFDRAITARNFSPVFVFDAAGDAILMSKTLEAPSLNVADRSYFQHAKAKPGSDLHVGTPIVSRLSKRWMVPLTRRISHPDGSFAGLSLGMIDVAYFQDLFEAAVPGQNWTVTLYGPEGIIIARTPHDPELIGRSVGATESYRIIVAADETTFWGSAMIGGGERQFSAARIGTSPLHLSVSMTASAIYAEWWQRSFVFGAIVLTLCALILVLTALFRRELHHRRSAERAMAVLNIELEALATSDALTGLSNRRRFDEVLARDVRRAMRQQRPLTLLLLDADHFKGFNDQYGHQMGDEALKLIARTIGTALTGPNDTCFRIGGEEFAVVLPETDEAGARIVAERIRHAVASRGLRHTANPHGIVTVSSGLAQLGPDMDAATFVAAADAALYESKRLGRNRVSGGLAPEGALRLVAG